MTQEDQKWKESEWELKCEFCGKPTPHNPCEECCKAIKVSYDTPLTPA